MNIKVAEAIGGHYWESADSTKKRVYFNADAMYAFVGLELSFYNTGNISHAILKGMKISNSHARKITLQIDTSKHYFDLTDNTWHSGYSAQALESGANAAMQKYKDKEKEK